MLNEIPDLCIVRGEPAAICDRLNRHLMVEEADWIVTYVDDVLKRPFAEFRPEGYRHKACEWPDCDHQQPQPWPTILVQTPSLSKRYGDMPLFALVFHPTESADAWRVTAVLFDLLRSEKTSAPEALFKRTTTWLRQECSVSSNGAGGNAPHAGPVRKQPRVRLEDRQKWLFVEEKVADYRRWLEKGLTQETAARRVKDADGNHISRSTLNGWRIRVDKHLRDPGKLAN